MRRSERDPFNLNTLPDDTLKTMMQFIPLQDKPSLFLSNRSMLFAGHILSIFEQTDEDAYQRQEQLIDFIIKNKEAYSFVFEDIKSKPTFWCSKFEACLLNPKVPLSTTIRWIHLMLQACPESLSIQSQTFIQNSYDMIQNMLNTDTITPTPDILFAIQYRVATFPTHLPTQQDAFIRWLFQAAHPFTQLSIHCKNALATQRHHLSNEQQIQLIHLLICNLEEPPNKHSNSGAIKCHSAQLLSQLGTMISATEQTHAVITTLLKLSFNFRFEPTSALSAQQALATLIPSICTPEQYETIVAPSITTLMDTIRKSLRHADYDRIFEIWHHFIPHQILHNFLDTLHSLTPIQLTDISPATWAILSIHIKTTDPRWQQILTKLINALTDPSEHTACFNACRALNVLYTSFHIENDMIGSTQPLDDPFSLRLAIQRIFELLISWTTPLEGTRTPSLEHLTKVCHTVTQLMTLTQPLPEWQPSLEILLDRLLGNHTTIPADLPTLRDEQQNIICQTLAKSLPLILTTDEQTQTLIDRLLSFRMHHTVSHCAYILLGALYPIVAVRFKHRIISALITHLTNLSTIEPTRKIICEILAGLDYRDHHHEDLQLVIAALQTKIDTYVHVCEALSKLWNQLSPALQQSVLVALQLGLTQPTIDKTAYHALITCYTSSTNPSLQVEILQLLITQLNHSDTTDWVRCEICKTLGTIANKQSMNTVINALTTVLTWEITRAPQATTYETACRTLSTLSPMMTPEHKTQIAEKLLNYLTDPTIKETSYYYTNTINTTWDTLITLSATLPNALSTMRNPLRASYLNERTQLFSAIQESLLFVQSTTASP